MSFDIEKFLDVKDEIVEVEGLGKVIVSPLRLKHIVELRACKSDDERIFMLLYYLLHKNKNVTLEKIQELPLHIGLKILASIPSRFLLITKESKKLLREIRGL